MKRRAYFFDPARPGYLPGTQLNVAKAALGADDIAAVPIKTTTVKIKEHMRRLPNGEVITVKASETTKPRKPWVITQRRNMVFHSEAARVGWIKNVYTPVVRAYYAELTRHELTKEHRT
jgi:hypothetical protein